MKYTLKLKEAEVNMVLLAVGKLTLPVENTQPFLSLMKNIQDQCSGQYEDPEITKNQDPEI